jgi:isopentenyl-diphosphate delta-isomerase
MVQQNELIVLLDDCGSPSGVANKYDVHAADTPYHLAFSCHVVNERGEILVTRRALSKVAWPGVWTNSYCGHPAPDESMEKAVLRRGRQELNISVTNLEVILPEFRYQAIDASGIMEHELCPVFIARTDDEPDPCPSEVSEYVWTNSRDLRQAVSAAPWAFSPWIALQLADPLLCSRLG